MEAMEEYCDTDIHNDHNDMWATRNQSAGRRKGNSIDSKPTTKTRRDPNIIHIDEDKSDDDQLLIITPAQSRSTTSNRSKRSSTSQTQSTSSSTWQSATSSRLSSDEDQSQRSSDLEQRALAAERMLKEERACREEAERQVRELELKATSTTTATASRGKKRKRESSIKGYEEQEEERPGRFGNSGQDHHPLGLFQHLLQHSARSSGRSHYSMTGGARYPLPSSHKRRPGVSDFARDFWLSSPNVIGDATVSTITNTTGATIDTNPDVFRLIDPFTIHVSPDKEPKITILSTPRIKAFLQTGLVRPYTMDNIRKLAYWWPLERTMGGHGVKQKWLLAYSVYEWWRSLKNDTQSSHAVKDDIREIIAGVCRVKKSDEERTKGVAQEAHPGLTIEGQIYELR